jgi:hypothetical protein
MFKYSRHLNAERADAFLRSVSIACSAFCRPVSYLAKNYIYLLKQPVLRIFAKGREKCKKKYGAKRDMEWIPMKGNKTK